MNEKFTPFAWGDWLMILALVLMLGGFGVWCWKQTKCRRDLYTRREDLDRVKVFLRESLMPACQVRDEPALRFELSRYLEGQRAQ